MEVNSIAYVRRYEQHSIGVVMVVVHIRLQRLFRCKTLTGFDSDLFHPLRKRAHTHMCEIKYSCHPRVPPAADARFANEWHCFVQARDGWLLLVPTGSDVHYCAAANLHKSKY